MKKLAFVLGLLFVSFSFAACSDDDDDKAISPDELPVNVKTFLEMHFPGQTIRLAEMDNDSYDVYLANGFEIEFDLSGEWDDVDGRNQAVPEGILRLLPQQLLDYVTSNYVDRKIYEVNKESFGYEIELDNRIELEFDSTGKFIRIDR